jgi:hypothetical protein
MRPEVAGATVSIPIDQLKVERDRVRSELRELELEQRKLEAELKVHRQREVQAKRQIEALTTLIDLGEPHEKSGEAKESATTS